MGQMGECRGGGGDCLIKLFGKTIPVPEAGDSKDLQRSGGGSSSSSSLTESGGDGKETPPHQDTTCLDPLPQPEVVDADDPKENDDDDDEANYAKEKAPLKKPDKVLPCPRCNSMDTKFCYFNNYNVNQPRHFCKNCQRYWTAGGAMRNVPVGAGRRKNKNAVAASQFLQRVRAAAAAGDPALRTGGGGTVLSFGAEHLKEKLLVPIVSKTTTVGPCGSEGSSNRDDRTIIKENVTVDKPANGAHMNGGMWPYSCAPPSQAYYAPGIAIPMIYPAAPGYWGCMVPAPGGWSLPWPPVQSPTTQGLSSPTSVSSSGAAADSLTLGKRARAEVGDEGSSSSHGSGGKVWAPKTIRIDDVDEVARSSIWSLIGIKGDNKQINADSMDRRTVFDLKHDAMKTAAKQAMITNSPLLHGNPVALSRSLTFQEGS